MLALRPVLALVTKSDATTARAVIVAAAVDVTRVARPAEVTRTHVLRFTRTRAMHAVLVTAVKQ